MASEIGTQARDLVGELKTQVHDQSVTQRDRLVDNLRRFGDDLDGMRQSSSSSGLATNLTGMLASKAREVSTFLSDHEPGDLIEEVRQFARQRPGTFLLGAAVAGVIAGRLTRGAAASNDSTSAAGSSGRHRLDLTTRRCPPRRSPPGRAPQHGCVRTSRCWFPSRDCRDHDAEFGRSGRSSRRRGAVGRGFGWRDRRGCESAAAPGDRPGQGRGQAGR